MLQDRKGQVLIGCQTHIVAVVADLSMSPPGASGGSPLMMSSEVALFAHKAERGLRCDPGKPLGGIGFKREYATLGTNHHIVPFLTILDARDDKNRLAWREGLGVGAGS